MICILKMLPLASMWMWAIREEKGHLKVAFVTQVRDDVTWTREEAVEVVRCG